MPRAPAGHAFLGHVKYVRMWAYAQSPERVREMAVARLMNADERSPIHRASLLCDYTCDEGSGTTVVDRGPFANNGTFSGSPRYVRTGYWRSGPLSAAMVRGFAASTVAWEIDGERDLHLRPARQYGGGTVRLLAAGRYERRDGA